MILNHRIPFTLTAATAAFVAVLLVPSRGQAPSAEEKAKTRAKQIAQTIELNSRTITIFDRQGKFVKTVGPKGLYQQPVFSPDAKRVAVVITDLSPESTDQFAGSSDIFVFDVATGAQTRITTSANREQSIAPVWSPDGTQIAYLALRNGTNGLYRKASNGQRGGTPIQAHCRKFSAPPQTLLRPACLFLGASLSADKYETAFLHGARDPDG